MIAAAEVTIVPWAALVTWAAHLMAVVLLASGQLALRENLEDVRDELAAVKGGRR